MTARTLRVTPASTEPASRATVTATMVTGAAAVRLQVRTSELIPPDTFLGSMGKI